MKTTYTINVPLLSFWQEYGFANPIVLYDNGICNKKTILNK